MLTRSGAWIFVSHSLKDFAQVRLVRNALEERGHFPLLFYLRCLHDDAEVDALIRREIDARNFFLVCDSPAARASRWVRDEVEIIQGRPRRLVARLDLDWPWERQLEVVEHVASRVNVYVSSVWEDAGVAEALATALAAADYSALGRQRDLMPGDDWAAQLRSDIDEAIATGFVVVLLSPEAVAREESWQWAEVHHAFERLQAMPPGQARVIPVVLRDAAATLARLPPALQSLQVLDLSGVAPAQQAGHIVAALDARVARSEG